MENTNIKSYEEWFFQSNYDIETAKSMFQSGRYIYCVFMCHLSLEKALKGLLIKIKNVFPPKTHNLSFLMESIGIEFSEEDKKFLFSLNKVSVPTRYPENLSKLMEEFNSITTQEILFSTERIQKWIIKN
jgi:HEPN domain-containing protein